MKCIICRTEKDEKCFNDEHVIPDSLGGHYHIRTVCIDCNSNMGERVDSPLVNHKLSELYRFSNEIAGKSGITPNPFAGTLTQKDSPDKRARADVGKDGKLEIYHLPEITWKEDNDNLILTISVDSKDEKKLDQIFKKAIARKNIPTGSIIHSSRVSESSKDAFTSRWAIDVRDFKIGLLKIAYEYAVDTLPEYFNDEEAIRISEILKNANYEDALNYVNIGNGLQPEIWEGFRDFLDLDSGCHYLALSGNEDTGLVCLLKLHDLFAVGVTLSTTPHLKPGEMHIGINSPKDRKFTKITGEDLINQCLGPRHTQPLFYLENINWEAAISEIEHPGFRYEGQSNEAVPLYDKKGKYICLLGDALEVAQLESKHSDKFYTQIFWLNPEINYHVKSVNTGNLYRIIAYKMEQEKLRKL